MSHCQTKPKVSLTFQGFKFVFSSMWIQQLHMQFEFLVWSGHGTKVTRRQCYIKPVMWGKTQNDRYRCTCVLPCDQTSHPRLPWSQWAGASAVQRRELMRGLSAEVEDSGTIRSSLLRRLRGSLMQLYLGRISLGLSAFFILSCYLYLIQVPPFIFIMSHKVWPKP